jgi:predicted esterase
MPTLVMLHGMTGTAQMMEIFAKSILPEGWNLLTPQAEFSHPQRGYTWWHFEDNSDPDRSTFTSNELSNVDSSLLKVVESLPDDDLVIGGFSQGGAIAMELLQFPIATKVKGIVAISTRIIRPLELKIRLNELPHNKLLWMHGVADSMVSMESGEEIVDIFMQGNWEVTKISHAKGHMIPIEFHNKMKEWLENIV